MKIKAYVKKPQERRLTRNYRDRPIFWAESFARKKRKEGKWLVTHMAEHVDAICTTHNGEMGRGSEGE